MKFTKITKITKLFTKELITAFLIYVFWTLIHYACARLYPIYCVPEGFMGYITSLFVSQSPHCVALRYGIQKGADTIQAAWIMIGTWCLFKIALPS